MICVKNVTLEGVLPHSVICKFDLNSALTVLATPARTISISGLKSRVLKLLKNDGKKWSRIYFEIHLAPSEIPTKQPGQFSRP